MSGPDIRALIDRLTVSGEESRFNSLFHEDIFRWFDFADLKSGEGGLADSGEFIRFLRQVTGWDNFGQLKSLSRPWRPISGPVSR